MADSVLKVLALTRYAYLGASSRLRIYQYVPFLNTMGIDVQVSPLLRNAYLERLYAKQQTDWSIVLVDYFQQMLNLLRAKQFDLLWIEKELFPSLPAWFEQMLKVMDVRYVVDYDDAVFHNYDSSNVFVKKKIDTVMRNAASVMCGNAYLADYAYSAGAKSVVIMPTVIDNQRYGVVNEKTHSTLVIGWIGSPSTVRYLEIVLPALQVIAKEFTVQLRVIGADFYAKGINVDCRAWSETSEVADIQAIDIGIMPLLDSPWERGKCGYKLIQYMACGKPVIASPVGVNQDIVTHGINGYLASNTDEWLQDFRNLLSNESMRLAMGNAGRERVEQHYCVQVTAPRLAQLFREIG